MISGLNVMINDLFNVKIKAQYIDTVLDYQLNDLVKVAIEITDPINKTSKLFIPDLFEINDFNWTFTLLNYDLAKDNIIKYFNYDETGVVYYNQNKEQIDYCGKTKIWWDIFSTKNKFDPLKNIKLKLQFNNNTIWYEYLFLTDIEYNNDEKILKISGKDFRHEFLRLIKTFDRETKNLEFINIIFKKTER